MKVFEAISRTLLDCGVDRMFGVMGDSNMRFIATYIESEGRYVGGAHESGAVMAADGWARLSGRTGVVTVTHGPGLTNALTAMVNSVRAHTPLVVITGTTPSVPEYFQEMDVPALVHAAGAEYRRVLRAEDLLDDLASTLRSVAVRPRTVVLDVPADLMDLEAGTAGSRFGTGPWAPDRIPASEDALDQAVGLIASANRPLILAGRGAVVSGAREAIFKLSDALHAPIASSVMGKGYLEDHPLSIGLFGGQSHSLAISTIGRSDCVLVLGAGLNKYTTDGGDLLAGKTVVHVDSDPTAVSAHYPATVGVTADVRTFSEQLVEILDEIGVGDEPPSIRGLRDQLAAFDPAVDYVDRTTPEHVDLRTALAELDAVLPTERNLVTDAGQFMTAPWRHLGCSYDGFAHSTSFGTIGMGLGMAIGAAIARPDRTTVCVVGDGGVMMAIQELAIAVAEELPMVLLVANDGAYGAEYRKLTNYGHDPVHSLCRWPSFADLGAGFGAESVVAHTAEELRGLKDRLDRVGRGPLVVDLRLDPAVDVRAYK